jgi:hypothetical protein
VAVVFVAGLVLGSHLGQISPSEPVRATVRDAAAPMTQTRLQGEGTPSADPRAAPDMRDAGNSGSEHLITAMTAGAPRALAPKPPQPAVREPSEVVPAALPAPAAAQAEPQDSRQPAWQRYAVPSDPPAGRPMIAVVIDDLGINRKQTREMTELPGPLTLAFMTYADDLAAQTAAARQAGHELMIHFPMEPSGASADPGPNALLRSLDPAEVQRRLDWGLGRFEGYIGINNHMGSAFTEDPAGMEIVLRELKRRGLVFLDSRTTAKTTAPGIARSLGVPIVQRDVFLDNVQSEAAIAAQLAEVERKARTRGAAIAIGHPYAATVAALRDWLPGLEERGFSLVPLSAIVRRDEERPALVSTGH